MAASRTVAFARGAMSRTWRPDLLEIPERPGVYGFRSADGTLLYIGKALNLRRRIASYFHGRAAQPSRVRRMIARARSVTVEETGSDLEALLRESQLLKRLTPPFNQLATRYVALPFIKLSLREPYPRVALTHEFADDGSCYLGPFPRHDSAAAVLAALQRLSRLRTCEGPIRPGVAPQPCAAYHVRKCAAPCVDWSRAAAYRDRVADVLELLAQGREGIRRRLAAARQRAAENLQFERASHLHSLLTTFDAATLGRPLALVPVAQRQMAVLLAQPPRRTCEVFLIREGRLGGRVSLDGQPGALARLRAALASCYGGQSPAGQEDGRAVADELRIVAAWLHRTRPRARWVPIDPRSSPMAAFEAIVQGALEAR
jgi:excinuclease UvrABC nuclease subunit